jgi:DUF4097 and DUF4098 domain-containing protein YvlB
VAASLRILNAGAVEVTSTDLGNILRSASGSVTLTAHNNGDVDFTAVSVAVEASGGDVSSAWVTVNGGASPQALGAIAAGADVDFTVLVTVPADGSQEAHAFNLKLTATP